MSEDEKKNGKLLKENQFKNAHRDDRKMKILDVMFFDELI